jgi:hypothetical protein
MSAVWWAPLILAAGAAGGVCWTSRLLARRVAGLTASRAGLGELRPGLADVEAQIAAARRAVEDRDLR